MAAPAVIKHPAPAENRTRHSVPAPEFAQLVFNRPLRQSFSYRIPSGWHVQPGMRVLASFGAKKEVGVCVGLSNFCDFDPKKIKAIERVLDPNPIIDSHLLGLTRWLADYYICSWGEALAAVLPPPLKRDRERRQVTIVTLHDSASGAMPELEKKFPRQFRALRVLQEAREPMELSDLLRRTGLSLSPIKTLEQKGLLALEKTAAQSDPLWEQLVDSTPAPVLSEPQKKASEAIAKAIEDGRFESFLLYGITGSGKTEVYLRSMEAALAQGKSAIILVPEISLTPQTAARFRSRFPGVAVLHSHLTDNQRLEEWRRIQEGKAPVVVGARSAVFAPVPNLGLIVVDEEHEPSFKQQNAPRYHARDVAVYRAQLSKAAVVLGSATPSLESYRNAIAGKYRLLSLPERVSGGKLPPVHLVDMRNEVAEQKSYVVFSRQLLSTLQSALERGEQAILFLNRRGFAPVLFCRTCGATLRCRRCDISLTFHRKIGRAVCHSCCEETLPPRDCPECSSHALLYLGAGSEKVEMRLQEFFPKARIVRMDSDTMVKRGSYEEVFQRFRDGKIDMLVGTQMIAKGLDFPNVTVVGVISADTSLHIPDFRAAERAFQLISQVAGRAGRGEKPGIVVVQSAMAEHEAIRCAIEHDYEGFAKKEMEHRKPLGYPPFGRAIRLIVEGKSEEKVNHVSLELRKALDPKTFKGVEVLGPAAAPISLLRGRHRWHILLKVSPSAKIGELRAKLHQLACKNFAGVKLAVDVDPISLL